MYRVAYIKVFDNNFGKFTSRLIRSYRHIWEDVGRSLPETEQHCALLNARYTAYLFFPEEIT